MANITCRSCGAVFDETLPACPYCDSTNPKGAEQQYMQKLHTMKQDLDQINEQTYAEEVSGEIREVGHSFKKVLFIVLPLALLITGIALLYHFFLYDSGMSQEEEYLWKQEHFPILDQYYADRDYENLITAAEDAFEEGSYVFYDWEHSDFVMELFAVRDGLAQLEKVNQEDGEVSDPTLSSLLYDELQVELYDRLYPNAPDIDQEAIAELGADLIADRQSRFPMSADTMESFLTGSGSIRYLDSSQIDDYISEMDETNK